MHINFKRHSWILFLAFLATSCEKIFETTVVLPPAQRFATFFLTDISDTLALFFKNPVSYGDSGELFDYYHNGLNVTDAVVFIDDGAAPQQMHYDSSYRSYILDMASMPLLKGKSYHVSITNADGTHLEASTSIPSFAAPAISFTATKTGSYYSYDYTLSDTVGQKKYFLLQFIQLMYDSWTHDTVPVVLKTVPVVKSAVEAGYRRVQNFALPYYFYTPFDEIPGFGLLIKPFVINEDMYLYFQSVEANLAAYNGPSFGTYAAPAPVYSNFNGGIGIFGPVISK